MVLLKSLNTKDPELSTRRPGSRRDGSGYEISEIDCRDHSSTRERLVSGPGRRNGDAR